MATVVITFFLFARFSVCKMDADCIERQRDQLLSRREKRWSMNSQRLEEIVAELMKPISDARRSFDTDLSALLEGYLTEAGLRALDAGEDSSAADAVPPNFAELALLLQQSATIYGRKVDFLYQHVLDVSDSLHNCTQDLDTSIGSEDAQTRGAGGAGGAARRRRRASSLGADFTHVALESSAAARRDPGRVRPPPTLPRTYAELEPRVLTDADAPLHDYAGEPIGLLADFQVTWRLHEGLLVDDLEGGTSSNERALRPISLVELQAAISAAVPPLPPPDSPERGPLRASTPLPALSEPDAPDDYYDPPPVKLKSERKRKSNAKIDNIIKESLRIVIGEDLREKLSEIREFSIPPRWIKKVVEKRKSHILSERRRLRAEEVKPPPEFAGWSAPEAAAATVASADSGRGATPDSDDDGFFEQSSVGESDASRADDAAAAAAAGAWQAAVLRRAAARAAPDVRAAARRVLRALAPAGPGPAPGPARPPPRPFSDLLRHEARDEADVSHLLLATLFLANSGNVEVIPGSPLSVNSFSLRLLSAAAVTT